MEKQEFIALLKEQIAIAESKKSDKRNVLDLRGTKYPYNGWVDSFVTEIDDLNFVWEFLKDAKEGYVDIYENGTKIDWIEMTFHFDSPTQYVTSR